MAESESPPSSPGFFNWCYNKYRKENSHAAEEYYKSRYCTGSPDPAKKKATKRKILDFSTMPPNSDKPTGGKRKKKSKVLLRMNGSVTNPIDIDCLDEILSETECDELQTCQTPNTSFSDTSLGLEHSDSDVDDIDKLPDILPTPRKTSFSNTTLGLNHSEGSDSDVDDIDKAPNLLPTPLKKRCDLHDQELESCLLCGIERSMTNSIGGEKHATVITRCQLHDEELGSCLLCGIERSVTSSERGEKHAAAVDTLLKKEGLCRIPCKGDGHCLLTAWSMQCDTDNETLISALEFEFLENFQFYEDFVTSGGLKNDLYRYLYQKHYENDVGDVIINALCNLSQRKAFMYEYCEGQFLRKSEVDPRRATLSHQPVVLIKIGKHYDACKSCLTETTNILSFDWFELEADEPNVTIQPTETANLYKKDLDIPIFSENKKSYKALELIEMLKNKPPPSKYQCKKLPYLVDYNMTFVVSVACGNVPFEDIQCDGHSGWVNDGVKRFTYRLVGDTYEIEKGKAKARSIGDVVLHRKYFTHKHSANLKKNILYIESHAGQIINNIVLIQYFFTGERHPVGQFKHGNATKATHWYCQTKPSVIKKVKEKCVTLPTTRAVSEVIKASGGISAASSAADIPNCKQLYDYKARAQSALNGVAPDDQIEMSKADFKYIVRYATEVPEMVIILATDEQLYDIERFCCSDVEFLPLTVDPTFKLGRYHVTPITYRNVMLSTNPTEESPPIMLGPMLIHVSKTKFVYETFFTELLKYHPPLINLKAYGTDGEDNLFSAMGSVFRDAIHLRCFRHFEKNVEEKLRTLGLGQQVKRFISEIFDGSASLLASSDNVMLHDRFEQLSKQWLLRDPSGGFLVYMKERVVMMKKCMLPSVRTEAGLGSPPVRYYSNDSESMNFRLKNWVQFKESSMPSFVRHMCCLLRAQNEDAQKAYTNVRGKYHVSEIFRDQLVSNNFFNMSATQKQKFLKKNREVTLQELHFKSGQALSRVNLGLAESVCMAVKYDEADISVSKFILQQIWVTAAKLIECWESACSIAPGGSSSSVRFCILSEASKKDRVEIVTWEKLSNEFSCSCSLYKTHCICRHTVACAEVNDRLQQFLMWHKKNNCKTNKHKRATSDCNLESAGEKGGRLRRKRNLNGKPEDTVRSMEDIPPCQSPGDHQQKIIIKILHGTQIRKCFGCSRAIRTPPIVPAPPRDIVLAARVLYSFTNTLNGLLKFVRDWKHFHVRSSCIKVYRYLGFHVCDSIKGKLLTVHKNTLRDECGVEVNMA